MTIQSKAITLLETTLILIYIGRNGQYPKKESLDRHCWTAYDPAQPAFKRQGINKQL
jgi:hypothetical protein